jgi:hypothetical protein
VNVKEASHLSNLPARATDAFTWNLIELPSGVISKTGACAPVSDGNRADAKRQKSASRISHVVCALPVLLSIAAFLRKPVTHLELATLRWFESNCARPFEGVRLTSG